MLLLKRMVQRQVMRAVYGAVAAVFLVGVLILLHIVVFYALGPYLGPLADSAVLLAVDLVIAVVFGVLAMRNTPDTIETEARVIRDQSLRGMKESLAVAALIGPVGSIATRMLGRKRGAGLTLAALAATFLSGKRK